MSSWFEDWGSESDADGHRQHHNLGVGAVSQLLPPPPFFRSPAERGAAMMLEGLGLEHERKGGDASPNARKRRHKPKHRNSPNVREADNENTSHATRGLTVSPQPRLTAEESAGGRHHPNHHVKDSLPSFRLPSSSRAPSASSVQPGSAPARDGGANTSPRLQVAFNPTLYKKLLVAEFDPPERDAGDERGGSVNSEEGKAVEEGKVVDFHTADYMNFGADGQRIREARYNSDISVFSEVTDGTDLAPPPPVLQGGRGFRLSGPHRAAAHTQRGVAPSSSNNRVAGFRLPTPSPSRNSRGERISSTTTTQTHDLSSEDRGATPLKSSARRTHNRRGGGNGGDVRQSPLSAALAAVSPIHRTAADSTTLQSASSIDTPHATKKKAHFLVADSSSSSRFGGSPRASPPSAGRRGGGVEVSLSPLSVTGTTPTREAPGRTGHLGRAQWRQGSEQTDRKSVV